MNDHERGQGRQSLREAWTNLSAEQQLGVTIFSVCGVLTLVFSGWYLRAQIRAPFMASRLSLEASRAYVEQHTRAAQLEEEQKTKDTDGDGLSNWDELNVYHTSPYLSDSDSDGIPDSVEIAQGTDPNCPKNRDCQLPLDGVSERTASSSVQTLLEGAAPASQPVPAVPTLAMPSATLTPAEIKQLIVSNHLATEADLQGLSDQALIELYQRGVRGAGAATPNALPSSP